MRDGHHHPGNDVEIVDERTEKSLYHLASHVRVGLGQLRETGLGKKMGEQHHQGRALPTNHLLGEAGIALDRGSHGGLGAVLESDIPASDVLDPASDGHVVACVELVAEPGLVGEEVIEVLVLEDFGAHDDGPTHQAPYSAISTHAYAAVLAVGLEGAESCGLPGGDDVDVLSILGQVGSERERERESVERHEDG